MGVVGAVAASVISPLAGPARASTVSTAKVVVPMVFPVLGGAKYSDTFQACRDGCTRQHLGQDLMAPKMRPVVAAFDGVVTSMRSDGVGNAGNYVCITGDNGWTVNYLHLNNDRPGTDDGKGTPTYTFMPGIRVGARVFAGQLIGWVGDSGNAENTSPHLHFELRNGGAWTGTVYNPKPSLDKATRLNSPRPGGPHPDGVVVQAGPGWTLWLLENGRRRRLFPKVFELNGYRPEQVIRVQASEVNWYPAGPDVPLRDGPLVRGPDNRVWVITGGTRVWVRNAAQAEALGVPVKKIPRVDQAVLNLTPVAADQTLPDVVRSGALLRTKGTAAVWWITADGTRRWVPDAITLASWGWRRDQIQDVPPGTLDSVPTGPALPLRAGTLFRAPTGKVFLVSNGIRRWIPNRLVLDTFGYRSTIVQINGTIMARVPPGPDLP